MQCILLGYYWDFNIIGILHMPNLFKNTFKSLRDPESIALIKTLLVKILHFGNMRDVP